MPFEDLSTQQRELLEQLVEKLASGNYESEFWALAVLGRGWFIQLRGQGGASSAQIDGFKETDLHALESEGYIMLIPKDHGFAASLKPQAYNEYKASKVAAETAEGIRGPISRDLRTPADGTSPATQMIAFDAAHLEQIERDSLALLEELKENYGLSRTQAASWFRWTLVASIAGFAFLGVGILVAWVGPTTVGAASAIGGVLSEFLGFVFFKQTKSSNDRQDAYHRDLITRQKLLDAIQVVQLISEEADRNRVMEEIIRQLLGISQDREATES